MSTRQITIASTLTLILAITSMVAADEAQDYADKMIGRLAAWKIQATRDNLVQKQEQYGNTAAYSTAWGLLLASEGDYDKGLESLKLASSKAGKDPAPEAFRALILEWKRDLNGAATAWKNAHDRAQTQVAAAPQDPRANYYLGAALVGLKKYPEARTSLQKALDKGFDQAMTHYQIGLSFALQQKWEPARDSFSAAITSDERFAYAYYHRGRVWDKLGRKDKMLNDLDQFVKLAPEAPDAGKAKAILSAAGR